MTIHVKAIVPFFLGTFFALMLASRYGSFLLGLAFFVFVTVVCFAANRFLIKSESSRN
ncbi:hypothetical protein CFAL_08320 [Corynebacterium falsenii DSM 44353]|nr:hypothetical protein CFAL_08320 [Corynebacterium falsenii DSM 44353]